MKTNQVLAAVVLLVAAGSVFASGPSTEQASSSAGKTRAQVRAELIAAREDGSLPTLANQSWPAVFDRYGKEVQRTPR